jgi:hypothetical protein
VNKRMDWKRLLAYITGTVDQELLLRNAYLVIENRILRNQLQGRVRLSDGERQSLEEIGKKLGRQALEEIATIVKPDTILAWHRTLVAQKFNGSQQRNAPGRPPMTQSWRHWWCASSRKTGAGAMIGLRGLCNTWGTPSATRPWAI